VGNIGRVRMMRARWVLWVAGWLGVGWGMGAADVAYFGILKSQEFVQTAAGVIAPRLSGGFAFNALVLASSNRVVTNATVKPSNATPMRTLEPMDPNLVSWRFEERFDSQAQLDGAYPNGTLFSPVRYTNTLYTVNDGVRTVELTYALLSLAGNPATPQVVNFEAAQVIDHTAEFVLRFNNSGNPLIDLVQVLLLDSRSNIVHASPPPFSAGALTGASDSFRVPAGILPAGAELTGHITFVRPAGLATNAYPGAMGVPAVVRDTGFPMKTRPAPVPSMLEILPDAGVLPVRLRYTGETNRNHHLQASENLTTWTDLMVTNASVGTFVDPDSEWRPRRYYRMQVGP